jgi:hypothetical protein
VGLSRLHAALLVRRLRTNARELGVTGRLRRLSQLLEEIEHFRGWRQQEVAKIVQCGEKIEEEAIHKDGLEFFAVVHCLPARKFTFFIQVSTLNTEYHIQSSGLNL